MPRSFEFPLTGEEMRRTQGLLEEFRKFESPGWSNLTLPGLYQVIFEGGVTDGDELEKATGQPVPRVTAPVQVTIRDLYLNEFDALVKRLGLPEEQVLRIVIVAGLVVAERTLVSFQAGLKIVPPVGNA